MVLVENTENDISWICDFCNESVEDIEDEIGEKVNPWRCSEDIKDISTKEEIETLVESGIQIGATNGCDYDICSRCIEDYRVCFFLILIFPQHRKITDGTN